MTIEQQGQIAANLVLKLLRELTRRGLDKCIVGDAIVTVGLAAVIEAKGVEETLESLRSVTADIEGARERFSTAERMSCH
ncbi:MAG: hypothetical protein ACRED5_12670 [Propylenella sp.]